MSRLMHYAAGYRQPTGRMMGEMAGQSSVGCTKP
jgi:hypothetical protein